MDKEYYELLDIEKEILFELEESIKKQTTELSANIEKYEDLKSIILSNEGMIRQLSVKIEEYEKRISQYEKEIDEKQQLIEEQKKYEDVKLDATRVTKLLISVQEKENELDEKKSKYEDQIYNLQSEAKTLNSKVEKYEELYKGAEQKYQNTVVELRTEKNKNQSLELEKKRIASKIEEKDKEIESLKTIKVELEQLKKDVERLKPFEDKYNNAKVEIRNMETERKELLKDYNWLLEYAKATDRKIVDSYNGNDYEFKNHRDWLIGKPKDEIYLRIIGEEYHSEINIEKTSNQEKNDCENVCSNECMNIFQDPV